MLTIDWLPTFSNDRFRLIQGYSVQGQPPRLTTSDKHWDVTEMVESERHCPNDCPVLTQHELTTDVTMQFVLLANAQLSEKGPSKGFEFTRMSS